MDHCIATNAPQRGLYATYTRGNEDVYEKQIERVNKLKEEVASGELAKVDECKLIIPLKLGLVVDNVASLKLQKDRKSPNPNRFLSLIKSFYIFFFDTLKHEMRRIAHS